MFTTINKLAGTKPLLLRGLRETVIASASGIAFTAVAFQAIYFMIFAIG
jgi:hypothetical protein